MCWDDLEPSSWEQALSISYFCMFPSFWPVFKLTKRSSTSNHSKTRENYSTIRGYNHNNFRCFTAHVRSNPTQDEAWIYTKRCRRNSVHPALISVHNIHIQILVVQRRARDNFDPQKVTYLSTSVLIWAVIRFLYISFFPNFFVTCDDWTGDSVLVLSVPSSSCKALFHSFKVRPSSCLCNCSAPSLRIRTCSNRTRTSFHCSWRWNSRLSQTRKELHFLAHTPTL